jgi:hypothetical protein
MPGQALRFAFRQPRRLIMGLRSTIMKRYLFILVFPCSSVSRVVRKKTQTVMFIEN